MISTCKNDELCANRLFVFYFETVYYTRELDYSTVENLCTIKSDINNQKIQP